MVIIMEYTKDSIINLTNKNKLSISGVTKLLELDSKDVLISTVLGDILIKGTNIEMNSLDDKNMIINLKGNINSISYLNSKSKDKGFITKLVK